MPIRLYPFFLITLGVVNLVLLNRQPQMVILGVVFLAWGLIVLVWQFVKLGNPARKRVVAPSAPAAPMKVISPDTTGLTPKPTCSISGSRNGVPFIPTRQRPPASVPTVFIKFRRERGELAMRVIR